MKKEGTPVRIAIYANEKDFCEFECALFELDKSDPNRFELSCLEEYDSYRKDIVAKDYDLLIVMKDGAHGMEACIGSKVLKKDTPLIWLSNDKDFGPQAFRIGCSYFSTKPITAVSLGKAFAKLAM